MIVPGHIKCSAEFSTDRNGPDGRGAFRYTLWRRNLLADDPGAYAEHYDKYAMFVCLNPSTADERLDDPTVKRCWKRSRALGYGSFVMTNLFAYRATKPEDMMAYIDPIGDWNDDWLLNLAQCAGLIVLAWGSDGKHLHRDRAVLDLLQPFISKLRYLALTDNSMPRHPLYLANATKPSPVEPAWNIILQRKRSEIP